MLHKQAVVWKCSTEKLFLEISQIHRKAPVPESLFLIKFIKKETLAQVFSSEFCEISKNREHPVAASVRTSIIFNVQCSYEEHKHTEAVTRGVL